MGTRYVRQEELGYTPTLDSLVVALCADYFRRQDAIEGARFSRRVDMEYRYLNYLIHEAAAEIAGEREALTFIEEIGQKIGYAASSIYLSENAYKVRKQEVKTGIARKLHLLD
ncbi:MAG: hypothetical protein IJY24_06270 [Clostridia bacterium]|nr:hypothetical protein [Clostridia bacterium]